MEVDGVRCHVGERPPKTVERLGVKYLLKLRDGRSVWFWKYFNVDFPAERPLEQMLSRASRV